MSTGCDYEDFAMSSEVTVQVWTEEGRGCGEIGCEEIKGGQGSFLFTPTSWNGKV